jgi:hypothetical protein
MHYENNMKYTNKTGNTLVDALYVPMEIRYELYVFL